MTYPTMRREGLLHFGRYTFGGLTDAGFRLLSLLESKAFDARWAVGGEVRAHFIVRGRRESDLNDAAARILGTFATSNWDFMIEASSEIEAHGQEEPVIWRGEVEAWTV